MPAKTSLWNKRVLHDQLFDCTSALFLNNKQRSILSGIYQFIRTANHYLSTSDWSLHLTPHVSPSHDPLSFLGLDAYVILAHTPHHRAAPRPRKAGHGDEEA